MPSKAPASHQFKHTRTRSLSCASSSPVSLLLLSQAAGAEVVAVEDTNWKEDAKGLPGQQMSLQLLLRVVADVGLVGFPNAGDHSTARWGRGRGRAAAGRVGLVRRRVAVLVQCGLCCVLCGVAGEGANQSYFPKLSVNLPPADKTLQLLRPLPCML